LYFIFFGSELIVILLAFISKFWYSLAVKWNIFLTSYWFIEDKKRETLPPLKDIRERCIKQLEQMRPDHMRRLNPTPYKVCCFKLLYALFYTIFFIFFTLNFGQVSVSAKLYDYIHFLWLNEAPVGELQ
jgi:nicotinate phosphoribosyltransferase